MARRPSAMSLLGTLVLAGCATAGPDAARRPQLLSNYATASLAGTGDWPRAAWWQAYGDPQLDALIDAALKGSPDVAAAAARVNRAQASTRQAQVAGQPTLSANASPTLSKQSYNNGIPAQFIPRGFNDYGRATLDFNYEIDFWGRNRAGVAAAASEARAAAADRASAELMLSTSVASTYAQLAQLHAERRVALASVALRQATFDQVRQRVAGGLDTQAESRTAEAGVPTARGQLGAIDEQIALTRDALAALTGAGPDAGLAITPPTLALAPATLPATLSVELIARKPEVVAARWRAEAAAKRIGVARAEFYPNVNLVAFIGLQSLGLGNLVKAGSDIGQVGPAIGLPIFDGGRLRANLRGAEADYALAVAQYDSTVVRALQDVADAATSIRALAGRLADARAALASIEAAYHVAQLRYTGGLANYQSVLLVEDQVLQSRRAVVDLEARALTLDVALIRALGGGYTGDSATLAAN